MKKIVPIVAVLASLASLAPASFTASMVTQAYADAGSSSNFHARGPVQTTRSASVAPSHGTALDTAALEPANRSVPGLPSGAQAKLSEQGADRDNSAVAAQRWTHIELPQPRSLDALTRVADDIQT